MTINTFPGVLQPHKWENAMSIDRKAWGFRRDARLEDYFTTFELISELVVTVSCGGKFESLTYNFQIIFWFGF